MENIAIPSQTVSNGKSNDSAGNGEVLLPLKFNILWLKYYKSCYTLYMKEMKLRASTDKGKLLSTTKCSRLLNVVDK